MQVFEMIYQLQQEQVQTPVVVKKALVSELQLIGLLGPLGQNLVGSTATPDPQLQSLPTGNGTVTTVTVTGDANGIVISGSPYSTSGSIGVTLGASLNVATSYKVAGTKVVGGQGAAVPDAAGGATIDAEARTAINTLLARMRAHGMIAP
jgi:hypothetical protein